MQSPQSWRPLEDTDDSRLSPRRPEYGHLVDPILQYSWTSDHQLGDRGDERTPPAVTTPPQEDPQQHLPPETTATDSFHLTGWSLYLLTVGLWIALFLSTLESTIVSTSLVSITNALDGFNSRDWIVTSYLLTYTGFLVIYARLGEILGRKTMFMTALFVFTLSSALCGSAKSVKSLIIYRAFQGIGGSGIFSMTMVIAPTLIPTKKLGKYIAIVSTVFAVATVLGPILGGVITSHSSWRWVFWLNVPAGVLAMAIVAIFLPSSWRSRNVSIRVYMQEKFGMSAMKRIDVLGALLLLASSILLVFSLEEAGTRYQWNSTIIIITLAISGACGVVFVIWEIVVDRSTSLPDPVFPIRLLKDRLVAALLLCTFSIGFPFVAMVINIPQRAQAVDGLSPVKAGLTLLPLMLCSPFATVSSGILTSTFNVPPFIPVMAGSILQLVGVSLMCSLPSSTHIEKQQYGYQVIMGLGFGLVLSTTLTLAPLLVSESDRAVTLGAVTQVRVLGGTIGLAICSTLLNNHVRSRIANLLTPQQFQAISDNLSAIQDLGPQHRKAVRIAFAEGFHRQNLVLTGFSGLSLIASLLLWERRPRRLQNTGS